MPQIRICRLRTIAGITVSSLVLTQSKQNRIVSHRINLDDVVRPKKDRNKPLSRGRPSFLVLGRPNAFVIIQRCTKTCNFSPKTVDNTFDNYSKFYVLL